MEETQQSTTNMNTQNSSDGFNVPVSTQSGGPAPMTDLNSSPINSSGSPLPSSSSSDFIASPLNQNGGDTPRKSDEPDKPKASTPINSSSYKPNKSKTVMLLSILVFILLLAAATFGVYNWQHGKVKDLTSKNSTLSSQVSYLQSQNLSLSSSLAKASKQLALAATPTTSTLALPTLGVEITLPSSLQGADYVATTPSKITVSGSSVTPIGVGISTAALVNLDKACSDTNGALGIITKTTGTYPTTPTSKNSSGTLVKQFSGYYIAYSTPSACSTVATTNTTQTTLVSDLKTAFSTIAVIQ
ncbi:MAG TPA: hypothetical protein VMR76_01820 [Candidatus Saccharimonadia bacterium]|nr:hypothetical protein [Candidatus Saccharimonadia bacterium]